jgi:MFS transporter, TsgA protein
MSPNKICLTVVSLLISFTLAGFGTQIGLLIKPMANQFNVALTVASSQFSWYLGGILLGNLLSLIIFRYFKIKWVVIVCYALIILAALGMHASITFMFVPMFLCVMGVALGVGVCASSTIITEIWPQRQRGSVLVSQDALFNSGGMVFPFVTASLLAGHYAWSWGYLVVAMVTLLIIVLSLIAKFDFDVHQETSHRGKTEWNLGITIAGISLFLGLICSFTPVIWLPVFLEEKFSVSAELAATAVPKIYLAGLIGSVLSAFIVLKVKLQYFLMTVVVIGCASAVMFTRAPSMEWISITAYAFGLAIAALYHSFLAWGLSYIKNPHYQHVTFMYICGGIGGTLAPYVSSLIVDRFGIPAVFISCAFLYGVILLMMLAMQLAYRERAVVVSKVF